MARFFKMHRIFDGGGGGDGGVGGGSVGGGPKDVVYAADMATLPEHWKPMSGLTQRTCIFHKDTWNRSITALDALYVSKILRGAFDWMKFDDFDDAMRPEQALMRASKKLKSPNIADGKKNFYDLTMSSDEEVQENVDGLADEVSLGGLGEIFRRLAVYKQWRVVEVDQLQNAESWSMQRSFMQVHKITDRTVTVFHGTESENIDGITREGLRAMYAKRSAYGAGIYVSPDFLIATGYASGDQHGVRHVVVLRCTLGSVKQVGYDSSEHGFFGSKQGDPSLQYHTKEVKSHKYFVVGSDAQLVCEAIIKVEKISLHVAQSYADFTSMLIPCTFERPRMIGGKTDARTVISYHWTKKFVDMLARMGYAKSLVDGVDGSDVGGGVGGVGGSGGGGVGGVGGVGGSGGGGVGGVGSVQNIPIRVTSTLAQSKKQLLSLKKQSVRDAKTDQDREKAKHAKLLARQAALPDANIDLPGHCFILKGSIVVLKNIDKSKQELHGAEGVVKLIVKECAEYRDAHMFMIEMKDHKLHPMITLANQRKERRYKQTGYSRYGDRMQEHYFIAKYSQMELQGDGPGTPSGAPHKHDSGDSA